VVGRAQVAITGCRVDLLLAGRFHVCYWPYGHPVIRKLFSADLSSGTSTSARSADSEFAERN
jgi:hypothetical protein